MESKQEEYEKTFTIFIHNYASTLDKRLLDEIIRKPAKPSTKQEYRNGIKNLKGVRK